MSDPARPGPHRLLRGTARALVWGAWPLALSALARRRHGERDPGRHLYSDLDAYREAGRAWLDGRDPYHAPTPKGFLFVYPPFALLASLPTAATRLATAGLVWNAAGVAALQHTLQVSLRRAGVAHPLGWSVPLTAAALRLSPIDQTLHLGQISLLLTGLVTGDLALPPRSRWAGVPIGLATGLKMVPGLFAGHLLATGRHRAAATAVATAAGTALLGAAAMPGHSRAFWSRYAFDAERVIPVHWPPNESMRAMLVRFLHSGPRARVPWMVSSAVVLAVAGTAVRAGERLGERGAATAVTALAGLLVSPVSHHHYWVWLVPNTVALTELAVRRRSPLVAAAAAAPLAVVVSGVDVRAIPRRSAVEDPMIALEPGRNVRVNSLTLATLAQLGGVAWHLLRRARSGTRDQGRFRRARHRRHDD